MTDGTMKTAMRKAWKEFEDNLNNDYYDINRREEDKVQKLVKKKKPIIEELIQDKPLY